MRLCSFCHKEISAGAPPEHVIPKWVGRDYPGAMFTTTTPDGRTIKSEVIEITVDTVCTACNGGWMSDLEAAAAPLLKPILRGENRGLSIEQQILLARWATKTSMTLDQTTPAAERIWSKDRCKELMDGDLVPPGTGVQLGRYAANGVFLAFGHNDLYRRAIPADAPPGPPDGFRTAIRINQLVVEVNWTSDANLDLRPVQAEARELLLPIWPTVAPIAWPPRIAMGDATWDSFIAPDLPDAQ